MAEGEEIQPLVVDNGTGMVKVSNNFLAAHIGFPFLSIYTTSLQFLSLSLRRLDLLVMMLQGQCSPV